MHTACAMYVHEFLRNGCLLEISSNSNHRVWNMAAASTSQHDIVVAMNSRLYNWTNPEEVEI